MIVGREIVRRQVLDSTMNLLDELAHAGAAEGLVVRADAQTAGRGRGGRGWESHQGGIYCSVLLRPPLKPDQIGALSLIAGVAVAEALEQAAPVSCRLRWPNDVLIGDKKVAGVLIKSRLSPPRVDFINVGIGIDVAQPLANLPPVATSLRVAANCDSIEVEHVFSLVLERLEDGYAAFLAADARPSLAAWQMRMAYLGEYVSVLSDMGAVSGVLLGVDETGRLLLANDQGVTEAIIQGDLVRGPRIASDARA